MKKLLYGMMAATIMFASSCQNELEVGATGDESVVSFTIATPEMDSRAYSDGLSATVLQYAVYDANGTYLSDLTGSKQFSKSTSVEIKLTTGNNYTVIFWASAPATNESSSPYTVDFANKTMTVNYTNAVSNDESRDAFYATKPIKVTGAMTESIELKRPFAQLNIGTNDFTESNGAGFAPSKSMVSVKSIYNTLNLWNGNVSGEQDVTFDYASIPTGEKFPVENYEYLSMNYLLVGTDKTLIDVEFGFTESDASSAKTRTVGSVPVQRNYRTNIYGQLLTSDVDVNVEIKPGYEEPDYDSEETPEIESTLDKLLSAAETGGEFILTEDIYLTEGITIKKDLIIYLAGHTISGAISNHGDDLIHIRPEVSVEIYYGTLSSTVSNGAGVISCLGNFKAKDVSFIQAPINRPTPFATSEVIEYNWPDTKMTLTNCKIIGGMVGIETGEGTLTLNNTDFAGQSDHCIEGIGSCKTTLNGGNLILEETETGCIFGNSYTPVRINFGTFNGKLKDSYRHDLVNIYGGSFSEDPSSYNITDGKKVIEKDGRFYVVNNGIEVISTSPIEADYPGSIYSGEALNDPNLDDVLGFKNWHMTDNSTITLKRQYQSVCFENVTANINDDFVINPDFSNTIIFYNCDITLGYGKKLVSHNNLFESTQVMIYNVKVNGEKLTSASASDYLQSVAYYEVW